MLYDATIGFWQEIQISGLPASYFTPMHVFLQYMYDLILYEAHPLPISSCIWLNNPFHNTVELIMSWILTCASSLDNNINILKPQGHWKDRQNWQRKNYFHFRLYNNTFIHYTKYIYTISRKYISQLQFRCQQDIRGSNTPYSWHWCSGTSTNEMTAMIMGTSKWSA